MYSAPFQSLKYFIVEGPRWQVRQGCDIIHPYRSEKSSTLVLLSAPDEDIFEELTGPPAGTTIDVTAQPQLLAKA